jgi:D-citramalate synthase
LRDGEQTPGVSLSTEDKVLISHKLDSLGVDIIEAGSAITSEGEREAIRAVAREGLNAEICSYCRVRREDIDFALECEVDSRPAYPVQTQKGPGSCNPDGRRYYPIR